MLSEFLTVPNLFHSRGLYQSVLTRLLLRFSEQRTMHRNDVQPYIVPSTEIIDIIGGYNGTRKS